MKKRLVACLVIVALLCSSLLPAAAAEETDLLVNGGFETGDSTGWNWFNNAVVDSAAPHSGNYCAKVAKNSSYEQVVTVSPDTKYVLTGWAKSEGSSVMTLGVKNYGGQETFSATLSADYQQLTVTFTTGPNAQTATIYGYRQNSGSGAGYFDDVELTAVQDFTPYQPLANAIAPQAIPTYDGTNQPTHPSVVKFEQPWNGYLYWMAMTPYPSIGLDAVVGSVGNGATLRLFSDIKNVKYTEGRFLPYFFPDTFHEGGDPVKEAKVNWVTARRAILRSPIQRIGYGGYLKLALEFPDFVQYIKEVCQEFRTLYDNIQGVTPYCVKRVAVLNCWGKMRSWGNHMVHHAIYYKQNYSYFGIIEALSGAPFDVSFISFDDILENKDLLKNFDVVINVGDADTAQSGGEYWVNETIITAVKEFVYNGGGFIGVGEPAAHQWQGHYFQLDDVLGVEEENGFNLNKDKYNWEEHRDHFILSDSDGDVDFGEGKKNIYALDGTEILIQKDQEVQMAVKNFGKGRGVYISGLPYSFKNSRVLYRAVLWSASAEEELNCWYSTNYNVEVHAYVKNGKYCVVNNTYEPQDTVVYKGDGSSFELHMEANEIKWYQI